MAAATSFAGAGLFGPFNDRAFEHRWRHDDNLASNHGYPIVHIEIQLVAAVVEAEGPERRRAFVAGVGSVPPDQLRNGSNARWPRVLLGFDRTGSEVRQVALL